MKTNFVKFVACLAAATVTATPVLAGDWTRGVKDLRGSGEYIPVPAPTPIPRHKARWYFRADVAVGVSAHSDPSESGSRYGSASGTTGGAPGSAQGPGIPFGFGGSAAIANHGRFENAHYDGGSNYAYIYGFGVGRYVNSRFRFDFTGEFRSRRLVKLDGQYKYIQYAFNGAGGGASRWEPSTSGTAPNQTFTQINGNVHDETKVWASVWMVNGYYDFKKWGRWTPYVGAGLGFSYSELNRTHTQSRSSCSVSAAANSTGNCIGAATDLADITSSEKTYTASLAASVTYGMSYKFSESTSLDLNYRYLYIGGSEASAVIGGGASNVDIGATHDHYFRAGLRWDIN